MNEDSFVRVPNDSNGNPRYCCHYLNLLSQSDLDRTPVELTRPGQITSRYKLALARARKIGGRKYHNKRYGGGIVFQAYSAAELVRECNKLVAEDSKE